ncbi:probable ATP7 - F1F0-ATPase complex, FO D subunit [Ustilago bromivora]|uniref:ATP synthase subunit d, mitochondrial n=1 Tax=Ustilago bromivora TaxID=307758 RepID=A0A8H8QMZ6_9BASI|nr:probable ATP7 - F1F0-ATPase complex, FO D subunit [Ustilago bromivora]
MAARAAAAAVDLAKISNLGLGKQTLAQISAFRKRADDAKRQLAQLKQQNTNVDFAHYNKVLRNKDVVSQAQKILSEFKPVTFDVQAQLKAIDAFEAKANIQDARSFDQLTVDDVVAARPEIGRTVDEMVKKGKWTTPGYDEKFGNLSAL